jgi:hypothetical protein
MSDCPSRTAIVFSARRSTDKTDLSSCFSVVNPQRLHNSAPSFSTSMVPHSGQNSMTPSFACPCNKGVWQVGSSAQPNHPLNHNPRCGSYKLYQVKAIQN